MPKEGTGHMGKGLLIKEERERIRLLLRMACGAHVQHRL